MMTALIVDDHDRFRAAARRLLEREGYRVVGEASDGRSALAVARSVEPDLVLLDVSLPDISGFRVATLLGEAPTPPVVILVSDRDRADVGRLAERTGALGFIPKEDLSGAAIAALLGRRR